MVTTQSKKTKQKTLLKKKKGIAVVVSKRVHKLM